MLKGHTTNWSSCGKPLIRPTYARRDGTRESGNHPADKQLGAYTDLGSGVPANHLPRTSAF